MMKKVILLSLFLVLGVLCVSTKAEAMLMTMGQGTIVGGESTLYNLIYDQDRDITWLDFSNVRNTWNNQVAWAAGLEVNFGGNTYDDWMLPTSLNDVAPFYPDYGFNQTGSEMGHLYYTELGNTLGELTDIGDFQNLNYAHYWSSTEHADTVLRAWGFYFDRGMQYTSYKVGNGFGLAVPSRRCCRHPSA